MLSLVFTIIGSLGAFFVVLGLLYFIMWVGERY